MSIVVANMPTNALDNPLTLPLLGRLLERPAHPYELTSDVEARYADLAARRSTVATLLKSLAGAGLVAAREPERPGSRPARTVYELTEAGVADLRRRIAEQLREGRPGAPAFVWALAYVGLLPRDLAAALLRERADRLLRERDALPVQTPGLAEIHMVEIAYWRALLDADAGWVAALARRVEAGELAWPSA
jgi:DNA-binding PadR family transcriptional regulator